MNSSKNRKPYNNIIFNNHYLNEYRSSFLGSKISKTGDIRFYQNKLYEKLYLFIIFIE
jgi:hypothetical protein